MGLFCLTGYEDLIFIETLNLFFFRGNSRSLTINIWIVYLLLRLVVTQINLLELARYFLVLCRIFFIRTQKIARLKYISKIIEDTEEEWENNKNSSSIKSFLWNKKFALEKSPRQNLHQCILRINNWGEIK